MSNLTEKYRQFLDAKVVPQGEPLITKAVTAVAGLGAGISLSAGAAGVPLKQGSSVGIVGAGAAGLYAGLLLKKYRPDVAVKIYEASDRVGGRIYTHWFDKAKSWQYFEAGAMRLPVIPAHEPVFDLIKYLNENLKGQQDEPIELIDYHLSDPAGNRVYVNGTKQDNGKIMTVDYANSHFKELGFSEDVAKEEAGKLLNDVISPLVEEFNKDFEKALEKYDSMTLHYYLLHTLGWSEEKINYVEVMSSQTNEFRNGLVDQVMLNSDFTGKSPPWKTINSGMCRLPEAMAKSFGSIELNTPVESLADKNDHVQVGYVKSGKMKYDTFDAVILAIPPSAIHMLQEKPLWPVALRHGLRAIHYQPLYKMGLRFKRRFWELPQVRPSKGGQSTTDLPCRWVVYPSYGLGDSEEGVLLLYNWMTDSTHWLPKSLPEKIKIALHNLQELYSDTNINIASEYAGGTDPTKDSYTKEAFPVEWAVKWPLGVATFYAGQFSSLYPVMKQSQGNIYFAGEHLSVHHAWIVGALESAKYTVGQLLPGKKIDYLKP